MQCVFYLSLIFAAFAFVDAQVLPRAAVVSLQGSTVVGNITFFQNNARSPVRIIGVILGLPIGLHGFHVHARGDITGGCASTGPHYNPFNVTHGGPRSNIRHVGDLGNIQTSNTAFTLVNIIDRRITLFGDLSIIGRAVVVHANVDDLGNTTHPDSRTTGNSGPRVSCGVIGYV